MIKINEKDWKCEYCGATYTDSNSATECEYKHDLIYVPIPRKQVYNLVRYLSTNDIELLPEEFVRYIVNFASKNKVR